MKKLALFLALTIGLVACGGKESREVVTEDQAGEYIDIYQDSILGEMSTSSFPEASCSTFENEDRTFSIDTIHISTDGNIRPVFTEPEVVVLDRVGEGIGNLERRETVGGEDNPNSYRLFYSMETFAALGIESANTEVFAYFDFNHPDIKFLTISEWDLNSSRPGGSLTRILPYRKTDLSETFEFNSLLDTYCR